MKLILPIAYLGNIDYYAQLMAADEVLIELNEHYVKQSFRSRCFIYGANGKLNLTVPIHRNNAQRTPIKDIRINNNEQWQKLHWRSLESAYRSSPYFEFYEDDLMPFYQKEFTFLKDLNEALHEKMLEWLQLEVNSIFTSEYQNEYDGVTDLRSTFHPRNTAINPQVTTAKYIQVFESKCGFIPNLSIVDLLFNEGPNASTFLQNIVNK
jgi:hypothetical protein